MKDCVFCNMDKRKEKVMLEDNEFIAVLDPAPITKGHTIAIPKRHMTSFFQMKPEESTRFYSFIEKVKKKIDSKYKPDGYNIGHNEGKSSGGSIAHLHVHIIPRYKGDAESPIGGIRNVLGKHMAPAN